MSPRIVSALALVSALHMSSVVALADTRNYTATAPDGVKLAVQESGDPAGAPIVLIHGLLGSHLSWDAQRNDPRLQRYRIITYDLRGHGLSDKPAGVDAYRDGRRWADDLAAVLDASHAREPVLVGWSLGAAVISNYLAAFGDRRIAGAVYVGGVIELKPEQITAHPEVYRDLNAPDLATHLAAERTFLGLCFAIRPDLPAFERLLASAAMASWDMQRAVPSMTVAASDGLSKARVPLLLIYGARDALVQAGPALARAMALNPRIRSTLYPGSGHAPFLEEPDRFGRELSTFVDAAARPRGGSER